jgi:hypothetical protein
MSSIISNNLGQQPLLRVTHFMMAQAALTEQHCQLWYNDDANLSTAA